MCVFKFSQSTVFRCSMRLGRKYSEVSGTTKWYVQYMLVECTAFLRASAVVCETMHVRMMIYIHRIFIDA